MLNNGDGTFRDASAEVTCCRGDEGLKLADIDLDGDLDLIHHTENVDAPVPETAGVFDAVELVRDREPLERR